MDESFDVRPVQKEANPQERQVMRLVTLGVWGMVCPSCANRVHNSLVSLEGVINAIVDPISGTAEVIYNPKMVNLHQLLRAVQLAGDGGRHRYGAQLLE